MPRMLRVLLTATAVVAALAIATPAWAATITVDTTEDELTDNDTCSLREAIIEANDAGVGVEDACEEGDAGADVIVVPAGTYVLDDPEGDLDITSEITIDPQGVVVIEGGGSDRVFHVEGTGDLTMSELTVQGGNAERGGGILVEGGTLTLTAATLTDNVALDGGGLANDGGEITLRNVTISGNEAEVSGGGIFTFAGGSLTLNNVTIADNVADSNPDDVGDGGGIFVTAGGTVEVGNTIIGDNVDESTGEPDRHDDCSGELDSTGNNLVEDTDGCTIVGDETGNILGEDPRLEPLGDYGGPTPTHLLKPNSPALNAGGNDCEDTDQRGVARPQESGCDIGAVELRAGETPAGVPPPPPGLECFGKKADIVGTPAAEVLVGTDKADVILALGGDDQITGGGGNDLICAGEGNDLARGKAGDDKVRGEAGNDKGKGGGGNDVVKGNKGNDRLRGQRGDDTLGGGGGNDRLNGGVGVDRCNGGPGVDRERRCEI